MIFVYDKDIKNRVKAKTNPEPWMHICLVSRRVGKTAEKKFEYVWAIYVWDTRQVIESGVAERSQIDFETLLRAHRGALDNHQRLQGADSPDAKYVSQHMNDRI